MKAMLVFDDMPNSCDKCEVRCDGYTAKEYSEKSIKRPSWCPLRPIPNKACEMLVKSLDAMEKMKAVEVKVVRRTE